MDKGKNYHKCGEIFLENEKIYTFLCLYCDELFYEFVEFRNHSITHFNSSDTLDNKINSSKFLIEPASLNYDHINIDSQSNISVHSLEFKKEEIEIEDFKENYITTEFDVTSSPKNTETNKTNNNEIFCAHCKLSYKINSHDFNKCSKIQDIIAQYNGDFIKLLREGVLCCFHCKRYFEDYKTLYDHHLEEEHCVHTGQCKICKFYIFMNSKINSKRKSNIKNNTEDERKVEVKKSNEINCEKCSVKFNSKNEYNIHFQEVHKELKDDLYNEKESAVENNILDNVMSYEKGELPYKCSYCKRLFRKKTQMKTHMRIHTNDRPYKCEICSAAFTVAANLKNHIVYKHTDDRPYVCEYEGCNAKFKLLNLKKQHEKRHLPANFQCEICGNYYKTKFCLLKHQQSRHEDAKNWPHQCEICTRRFARQHHLVEHKRTHTGEKPFGCDLCSKFFRKRSALREHKKLHSDEKKYVCRFCGKGFKQAAGYWGHMKRHPAVS